MAAVLSMSSIAPYGGDSLASETQTEIETESEIMTDTERETESIGETAPETEAPILETEALYRRRKHLGIRRTRKRQRTARRQETIRLLPYG